jgi:DNA polymerase IV
VKEHKRYIAHLDLDAFFVSVECINDPTLKGKPLIVGGSRERGVVTTCSYEARKFGVKSAMPMATAIRLCPQAIVLPGTRGEYSRYSRWVTNIIAAKAPLFEKASIDEFYIDLTGMDTFFDPYQWTIDLRSEIIESTGLPLSFGLGSNKFIAKIAANEAKPNGYLFIPHGSEQDWLSPLPVNKIPGVGDHLWQSMQALGILTIGDLASRSEDELELHFGKYGHDLYKRARGIHNGIVAEYHEAKSISTENTFDSNTADENFLLAELVRMTEKVTFELRQDNKMCGCVAVKLRYSDFSTTSRQTTVSYTYYDDELIPVVHELYRQLRKKGEPVRLIGVRLSELVDGALQTNLFQDADRKSNLYKAIDEVKNRFGKYSVRKGRIK